MSAFRGSQSLKRAVLDGIGSDTSNPLIDPAAEPDRLAAWAEENGLPAALVILAWRLAFFDDIASAAPYLSALIEAIGPGAVLDPATHEWVRWAWHDAPVPLSAEVGDSAHRACAEEIVALHARAGEGGTVTPGDWRAARGRMTASGGHDLSDLAAAAIVASAWDFTTVPAAPMDVVAEWSQLLETKVRARHGWDNAKELGYNGVVMREYRVAAELCGPQPDEDDAVAVIDWSERCRLLCLERLETLDDAIVVQARARDHDRTVALAELRDSARAALVRCVARPAPLHEVAVETSR